MKYEIYKKYDDGTSSIYRVSAYNVDASGGLVIFYNEAGGVEAVFKDFDSIVPSVKGKLNEQIDS